MLYIGESQGSHITAVKDHAGADVYIRQDPGGPAETQNPNFVILKAKGASAIYQDADTHLSPCTGGA